MVIHFERHGAGASFVDLAVSNRNVVVRSGRLGTQGDEHFRQHETEALAHLAYERQISRLEAKGYWVGHHEPSLIAAIRSNPDDAGRFQVYADWLLERQDPRGALIASTAAGNQAETKRLLDEHAVQLQPTWWAQRFATAQWSLGFIHELSLSSDNPWALRRMLRHPSSFVLRRLVLITKHPSAFGTESWLECMASRPESLREIVVPPNHALAQLKREVSGIVVKPL